MKIIKRRKHCEVVSYCLFFERKDLKGAGFTFDCDKDGKVLPLKPLAQANYDLSVSVDSGFQPGRIEERITRWTEPTVIQCHCGVEVELTGFTNTCDSCNRDYGMSGHELADRSQWGSETGESLGDILSIDSASIEELLS